MPSTWWKGFERLIARRYFGAERVGPVGKFGPDVVTDLFSVECRQRKTITYSELEAWAAEVRRECAGRVPVLAVRRPRGRGHALAPTLFVLDEKAWLDLHGPDFASRTDGRPST